MTEVLQNHSHSLLEKTTSLVLASCVNPASTSEADNDKQARRIQFDVINMYPLMC